jgi:uncharacterized protein (DUF2147 family)
MKRILFLIIIVVLFLPCSAATPAKAPGDAIIGNWLTDVHDAKVQVYRSGNTYYGKIVWLKLRLTPKKTPLLDNLNPNPKLRSRTRENITALTGLVFDGKGKYSKGTIYYPTNGKTYRCNATLVNNNTLKLRLFLGISLIGQTTTFTRVK